MGMTDDLRAFLGSISEEVLATHLRGRGGWRVERDAETTSWMSCGKMAERAGMNPRAFSAMLAKYEYKIPGLLVERCRAEDGTLGRARALKATGEFFEFLAAAQGGDADEKEGA